jgi:uncharacterized membrane protein YfcA
MIAALALTLLVGVSLGALGSGGAMLALPLLVHVAGFAPREAVAMSLVIVGGTSMLGAYVHYRLGNYHFQATLLLASTGVICAYAGSWWTHLVPGHILMLIFAGLLAVVGANMLLSRPESGARGACRPLRCVLIGAGVGWLTGFLGVGGGFLIVPALVLLAGIETRKAIGASLAIITLNSAAGFVGQLRYIDVDPRATLLFLAVAMAGMLGGIPIANRLPEARLLKIFGGMLLTVAAAIGAANLMKL